MLIDIRLPLLQMYVMSVVLALYCIYHHREVLVNDMSVKQIWVMKVICFIPIFNLFIPAACFGDWLTGIKNKIGLSTVFLMMIWRQPLSKEVWKLSIKCLKIIWR